MSRVRVDQALDAAAVEQVRSLYDEVFADQGEQAWRAMWATHSARDGFRVARALDDDGGLLGFAWGYTGQRGQWWTDRLVEVLDDAVATEWLGGHREVVSMAVRIEARGRGLGRSLLGALVDAVPGERALLQTSADLTDPAHRLYAGEGWRVLGPGVGTGTVVMGLA